MAKNIEKFRDELTKLAQVAEILEKSFFSKGEIKVEVSLDNDTFSNLLKTLRNNSDDLKCTISIGDVDFTFLKK
jgi:hypothetical protein